MKYVIYKKCSKCKIEKSLKEFYKDKLKKDGLCINCKKCVFEINKEYYQNNREKRLEYHRNRKDEISIYRQKNKVRIAAQTKQYRQNHKEGIAARMKQYGKANEGKILAYRQDNKDKSLAYAKQYRQNNKDKIEAYKQANRDKLLAQGRKYCQDHKDEKTAYRESRKDQIVVQRKKYHQTEKGKATLARTEHKRRSLKVGVECEKFNPIEVLERDNYICQLCGYKTRPDYKNQYHPLFPNLDHIIPLSKGGAHTRLNTQCLCHQCNSKKGNTGIGDQLRLLA